MRWMRRILAPDVSGFVEGGVAKHLAGEPACAERSALPGRVRFPGDGFGVGHGRSGAHVRALGNGYCAIDDVALVLCFPPQHQEARQETQPGEASKLAPVVDQDWGQEPVGGRGLVRRFGGSVATACLLRQ